MTTLINTYITGTLLLINTSVSYLFANVFVELLLLGIAGSMIIALILSLIRR